MDPFTEWKQEKWSWGVANCTAHAHNWNRGTAHVSIRQKRQIKCKMNLYPDAGDTSTDMDSWLESSSSATGAVELSEGPEEMPLGAYLAWAMAFGVLVAVSVIGNSLVIWAVVWHRRMRTVTNYFVVNLALADLSMAAFNVIFSFIYMLNSDWIFGRHYCTFSNFMANLTVAASVFTLVAISADRYTAIMHPLKPRMSKLVAMLTILLVWTLGSVLSLPNLLYSSIHTFQFEDGTLRTICYLYWPDGPHISSRQDYVYNIIFPIVTYLIPMSVITVTYIIMGRELWGSKGIGESTDRQLTNIRSKRRVVRMFIAVVVMFGISWLPYHIYFLVQTHLFEKEFAQHLFLAFYWLAMSSAMYSPIIYFRMNSRFQAYFLTAIRCFGCVGPKRNADPNTVSLHSASTTNTTNPTGTGSLLHLGKWSNYEFPSVLRCWSDRSLVAEDNAECHSSRALSLTPNGTTTTSKNSRNSSENVSRCGSAMSNGSVHSPVTILERKPLAVVVFRPSARNSDVVL